MDIEPPFEQAHPNLFQNFTIQTRHENHLSTNIIDEYCDLPLIDLERLNFKARGDKYEPLDVHQASGLDNSIMKDMVEAASNWGFFQVVNHGIPTKVLESSRFELMKIFHNSFSKKSEANFMNFSVGSYRWGNPRATCLSHFSWSEAFHLPLTDVTKLDECSNSRSNIRIFATKAATLAPRLAGCLAQNLGVKPSYFYENCVPSSSYLRMNRYPLCPLSRSCEVYGLMPHTDSDFLTILYQDQVGGLQLMKDGRWLGVKPNPEVLIINIGDLFQALSNGVYRSVEHRVVAHPEVERFSVACFYCPSQEAVIESCSNPALYRKFSFSEYSQQIQKDVQATGQKLGLSRFFLK